MKKKKKRKNKSIKQKQKQKIGHWKSIVSLRRSLPKSGPLHFRSKNRFLLNFAYESFL